MCDVSSQLTITVREPADIVLSIAAATPSAETLCVTLDGDPLTPIEIAAPNRSRLHHLPATPPGRLMIGYHARVAATAPASEVTTWDEIEFSRPSRYCDSDRMTSLADTHFRGLTGTPLVRKVRDWVLCNVTYAPGSSRPFDGAMDTYLSRLGVCRDSAHLVIALLRARGVPARLVSVYAPGLRPMDFHAVVEVALNKKWYVVDATGMAPRPAMVRIATGRDAADTAFLTVNSGIADLIDMRVTASTDPPASDDGLALVQLKT